MQLNGKALASNTPGKQLGPEFKSQYWNKKKPFYCLFLQYLDWIFVTIFLNTSSCIYSLERNCGEKRKNN